MGWSVSLLDNKDNLVEVEPHYAGSNICLGGQQLATMTVTFNYSPVFKAIYDEGFRDTFDRVLGCESEYLLERGIMTCRDVAFSRLANYYAGELKRRSKDSQFGEVDGYWLPTTENIISILSLMLDWAKKYPNARWSIDA